MFLLGQKNRNNEDTKTAKKNRKEECRKIRLETGGSGGSKWDFKQGFQGPKCFL